ncbi:MAG: DUF4105 domain-containing protein, partial [Bacteroidia bacterium]|nr:DUF4105 domain-containing protein [Bacteroidia bacterium]
QHLQISEEAEISILTIGPGDNLYDKFGHSAFRINDPVHNRDLAFNYGTYDFNTPNFYTKFARGKLMYSLSVESFRNFHGRYLQQDRWIKEQVLNLNSAEKKALFDFLINNAQPENKDYLYDFCFDNCATRIRDVLVEALDNKIVYNPDFVAEPKSFRQLIQQNVHWNSWGSLGMDIAIGAVTDVEATAWEHQFLPDYVFEAAAKAEILRDDIRFPLVVETRSLHESSTDRSGSTFFKSPLFVFGLLSLLIIGITIRDNKRRSRSRYLDGILFFTTGLIGIILLLLWLGTDHSTTANNYNLLWAFPFSILFTLGISKEQPRRWLRRYIVFLLLLLALLTLHAVTGVQGFALSLVPLFLALAIRYFYLVIYLKKTSVAS